MKNHLRRITLCAVLIFTMLSLSQSANAQLSKGFRLSFFPDRFMQGNCLGTFTSYGYPLWGPVVYSPDMGLIQPNTAVNLRDFGIDDRAKSVVINSAAGVNLTFFNNADGDATRGICIVYVKQAMAGYVLDSFERTYEDNYIQVTYWSNGGGINGQLSCFASSF